MIDDIVKTEKAAAKGKADIAKAGEKDSEDIAKAGEQDSEDIAKAGEPKKEWTWLKIKAAKYSDHISTQKYTTINQLN